MAEIKLKLPLSDKDVRDILWHGVSDAQEKAAGNFAVGQTIAHPSDQMTYRLDEIRDDVLLVSYPENPKDPENSRRVNSVIPRDGAFNPNDAMKSALQKRSQVLDRKAKRN